MSKIKFLFFSFLLVALFFTSCKKDESSVNESQVLIEYLESADSPLGKDFVNTDMPTIMPASDVKTLNETGQVYIIDIRSADDFNNGHIANAHNVAFADLLTHIESVDLTNYTKVAIVCYTGQTAGYGACILRLMGYDKVFSMKWGMCSWNADFAGKWNSAIANGNAFASQFTTTATDKGVAGELPTLNTGKETGQDILEARVSTLLADGFTPATVTNQTVFGNLSGYYIINYWPANHYADPGHIPGAVQYTPKESMKLSANLKQIPIGTPIALYCYTGQTSAFLTAYLRLIGYDAKSILFGTNAMIYDKMVSASMPVFSDSQIMGYDYVK